MSQPHAVHRPLALVVLAVVAVAVLMNWNVISSVRPTGRVSVESRDDPAPHAAPVIAWTASLMGDVLGEQTIRGSYGGVGRIAAAADRLASLHTRNVVLLDAGSVNPGIDPPDALAAAHVYEGLALAGTSVCNVGRGEQLLGANAIHDLATTRSLTFVSLNVTRLDRSPVDARYVTVEVGGRTLLITGVAKPIRAPGRAQTTHAIDPIDAVRLFAAELPGLRHDHAVLLADVSAETLTRLAAVAEGFDAILGGAQPLGLESPTLPETRPLVLAVHGSGALGVLRLGPAGEFRTLALDDAITPAERTEALAAGYLEQLHRLPRLSAEPERVRSRAGGSTYGFTDPPPDPATKENPPR